MCCEHMGLLGGIGLIHFEDAQRSLEGVEKLHPLEALPFIRSLVEQDVAL